MGVPLSVETENQYNLGSYSEFLLLLECQEPVKQYVRSWLVIIWIALVKAPIRKTYLDNFYKLVHSIFSWKQWL
jgi:hypothetical protein